LPCKVAQLEGTLSEATAYEARHRICDLGYLRHLYRKADGSVGYRCPSEPVESFVRRGGTVEQTTGRICVCNGLPATVGLGQVRADGSAELPFLTADDDLSQIAQFVPAGRDGYTAADVVRLLLRPVEPTPRVASPGLRSSQRKVAAVLDDDEGGFMLEYDNTRGEKNTMRLDGVSYAGAIREARSFLGIGTDDRDEDECEWSVE
jgi:hypothetical protein